MKKTFSEFFVAFNTVGYKPEQITLASGKKSYWYINARVVSKTLALQEKTAAYVVDLMQQKKILKGVDAVLGVPEGAAPVGSVINRFLIKKKYIPDDPVNRFWVTGQAPKNVIVFEDITTTAGSALTFIESLQAAGVRVKALVSLVNREHSYNGKTVDAALKEKGIAYYTVARARDVLPLALKKLNPEMRAEAIARLNAEYQEEYAPKKPPFVLR
jgi:orotate phosphoribosyltransferase